MLHVSLSGRLPFLTTITFPSGHCLQFSALPVSWALKQKYSSHFNQPWVFLWG